MYTEVDTTGPDEGETVERSKMVDTRSAGFTLIEVMVTMLIVMVSVMLVGAVFVAVQTGTQETERRDQAQTFAQKIMAKARQVDYSELGFYTNDPNAPSGVVDLPVSTTTAGTVTLAKIKERAVVLGATRPAGTSLFTEGAVHTYTDRGFSYRVSTWVTEVPAIAPDTVSRSKRVTILTEWAPTGAVLNGSCGAQTSCAVQTMSRAAGGSDVDPVTGNSAYASSACRLTTATICETFIRSGRVLDGARMATRADVPLQSEPVDLYARTTKVATSVTATWTYVLDPASGASTKKVTVPLASSDGGTRWTATIPADPVHTGAGAAAVTPKGDIRPGAVDVTYTAKIAGATVTTTEPAFWSFTLATGASTDGLTAVQTSAVGTWCSAAGSGAPLSLDTTGHSVGLSKPATPTSSADTLTAIFTVPAAGGVRTIAVPAVLDQASPVFVDVNGTMLPSSAQATWTVTPPATSDCAMTSDIQVVIHRASDASDTVLNVRAATP